MKLFKYGLPFAALALLASCANDNMGEPTPDPTPSEPIEGMYVSFNIGVPTTKAQTYEEGEDIESKIKNIWLYLYRQSNTGGTTTEDAAKLYKVKQLGAAALSTDTEHSSTDGSVDVVNGVVSATFQIDDMTQEEKDGYDYYALVIINQGITNEVVVPKLPNTAEETNLPAFSAWKDTQMAKATGHVVGSTPTSGTYGIAGSSTVNPMIPYISDGYYFTMTNAPMFVEGTTNSVETLAKLTTSNFATSPQQAKNSAATIFVQRGVAKVTVNAVGDKELYLAIDESDPSKDVKENNYKVEITGWSLDNLNTTSYALQHVETAANLAEAGTWGKTYFKAPMGNHYTSASHILWSKDPEYDQQNPFSTTNEPTEGLYLSENTSGWNGLSDAEYCLENTMKAKMMQKNQTTGIIFQAKLKQKDGDTWDKTKAVGDFVIFNDIICPVDGKVQKNGEVKKAAAEYTISELILSDNQSEVASILGVNDLTNDKVTYYPEGITYYSALIRHFSESGQPGFDNRSVTDLDQYKEEEDLGRYGVVRNNTYKATVGKVYGFGSNNIPKPGPEPNDNPDPKKYNVMLNIEVLNWAIRSYDYTIK